MLLSTFQHIRGIGKKTEQSLWKRGITDWEKLIKLNGKQLSLFKNHTKHPLEFSINAFQTGQIDFFAKTLPRSEFYRIALTYPDQTLFLDIETTGLSLYYDQITLVGWSIGEKYGVYIKDQDASELMEVLRSAKAIVTFNGTIFDLKFLKKAFPDIPIPEVHIDLRFFARRTGLSGGQKAIEPKVGYKRPKLVDGMEGEAAPILWYRYRRGELSALKELITYNHADIEGMKWILDYAIKQTYLRDKIPDHIRPDIKFSKYKSQIQWVSGKPNNGDPYKVYLHEFSGHLKPLITFKQLNRITPLADTTFIGIDLVSSEERESGFCILKGNKAKTSRVKTDAEFIQLAYEAGATLISIDSPLSIPKGRKTYFDDDPGRNKYGIMRECERLLKRRGVNVYPCLIPSMQKLTRRGIQLAHKFRKIGIPVIESYPGAAQDIMSIPRKRAGLKYLADALVEFGIFDNFTKKHISHDELDAITSAIVGIFFWTGKFEGIGNEDEDYLIIPDLHADSKKWKSRKVIGLSDTLNPSIRTTIGKKGLVYFSINRALGQKQKARNEKQTAEQNFVQFLRKSPDPTTKRQLLKKYLSELPADKDLIIDGLSSPEDRALMVEIFGPSFVHLQFDASVSDSLHSSSIENDAAGIRDNSGYAIGRQLAFQIKEAEPTFTPIILKKQSQTQLLSQIDVIITSNRS